MNKRQILVLWIGIIIIAAILLFPPMKTTRTDKWGKHYSEDLGYRFITDNTETNVTVNYEKLFLPIAAVALIWLGLFFSLKDRGKR